MGGEEAYCCNYMGLRLYFVEGDISQLMSYRFHRYDSMGTDGNLKYEI